MNEEGRIVSERYARMTEPTAGRRGFGTFIQLAGDAFVGFSGLYLATGDRDGAEFAGDAWRWVLGGTGAFFAFIAVRFVLRLLRDWRPNLDDATRRRARAKAKVFAGLGVWLLALAVVPAVSENTVELDPWIKVGYGITGALNVLLGIVMHWDPTRFQQVQRVRAGEGMKGRARILRANDTGTLVNEAPQVEIDFEIDVDGRAPYEASDKIVMQQAKLALLIPGATVGVTVDRVDPEVFHLDWDDWEAPVSQ